MINKDGKVVKTIMHSFSLGEISAVDRPAQKGARVAIMKREEDEPELKKVDISMALTTMTAGHSHLINAGGGAYRQHAGTTDYTDGHNHPWLMDEAGNITVGHAQGHNHGIEVVAKGEVTEDQLKKLMSKEGSPAASLDESTSAGNPAAEAIGTHEDVSMTPEEKKAAEAAAATQKAEMDKITKRAERAESIANLSDTHRSYFKSLKGADADTFLAANDTDRDETIRKAQESNQIVYTAVNGTIYRKQDDPRLVTMAKEFDAERAKRRESDEKVAKADLAKRAEELTHIPGTPEVRMSLLKGIDALPEAERAPALAALKAQNARLGLSFERNGTSDGQVTDNDLDPLDAMAAEIAKRDKCTFEQAYSKALNTPEGQKLYHAHVNKRQGAGSY